MQLRRSLRMLNYILEFFLEEMRSETNFKRTNSAMTMNLPTGETVTKPPIDWNFIVHVTRNKLLISKKEISTENSLWRIKFIY